MRDLGATRIVLDGIEVCFPRPDAATVPDGHHAQGVVEIEDDGIPLELISPKPPQAKVPDLTEWYQSQPPPSYVVEG